MVNRVIHSIAWSVLACGILACIGTFFYPFWFFWLLPRPMFSDWVGESHTAWTRTLPLRDSSGTSVYFDESLNIVVVVCEKEIKGQTPIIELNAARAIFQVDNERTVVSASDSGKLVLVLKGEASRRLDLGPTNSRELRRKLVHAFTTSMDDRFRLLDSIVEVYDGPAVAELSKLNKRLR